MGFLVNDIAAISGTLSLPRVGRWTADLVLDSETAPTGMVTLSSDDGGMALTGTVRRGGEYTASGHVNLVGGSGGLENAATPAYYRSVTARHVVSRLLAGLGESLSATSDSAPLGKFFERWVVDRIHGGAALSRVADAVGVTWRVLDGGSFWLGTDTFPESQLQEDDYEILHESPAEFKITLGTVGVPYQLRPGQTFLGKHVAFLEYSVGEAFVETSVWFERDAQSSHPVLGPLQAIVRDTMRDTKYHSLYLATVTAQRSDDSLDLRFDDASMPAMTEVPLMKFAPGIAVRVATGARVLVAFAGGSPSSPIAVMWASGVTTSVPVKTCGRLDVRSTVPGTLTIAYTPPGGVEQATNISLVSVGPTSPIEITVPPGSGADLAGRVAT